MIAYRPSNGSEGEWFASKFCDHCRFDAKYQRTQDGRHGCKLIARSMAYNVDDPKYPKEWTYDAEGNPTCTKFALPAPRKRYPKKRRPLPGQQALDV